jgi:Ser/Thr protein kinase RdoA (MazF antagonist)
MDLRLDDGTAIVALSRPRQGSRHSVLFGVEEASGREVAVKIELIPDTLEIERRALEWLSGLGGPVPRLRAAGTVASADHRGALCLVMDRADGEAPTSPEGWARLGRALARLSSLPWEGSGLAVWDHRDFLTAHDGRVADLSAALGTDLGETLPAVPRSYPDLSLALTHGDPGPGNFLDDRGAGTLLDWEDAYVAPRGLDLGRAAFIALLGAGPEGYEAREEEARSRAVVSGFLSEADGSSPDDDARAWWLAVAGVQFAHRRLERAGQPGVLPWRDATEVLDRTLED